MEEHHEGLIEKISEEYKNILANSNQGVYIYLDDSNKVCNQKFSSLLGYASPEEWAEVNEDFPSAFVAEESQQALVTTYQKAMEDCAGSKIKITWKKKTDGAVDSDVILVPVSYKGHLFALHFVS